jgi:hypothetical protein
MIIFFIVGLSSGWPPGWLQTLMEFFHIDIGKEITSSGSKQPHQMLFTS